jgi:hypothetical protein
MESQPAWTRIEWWTNREETSMPTRRRRHLASERFAPGTLLEGARRWSLARVTYDRIADVSARCPNCDGLVMRCLGPGVLCGSCGRLWIVREMLEREAGQAQVQGAA